MAEDYPLADLKANKIDHHVEAPSPVSPRMEAARQGAKQVAAPLVNTNKLKSEVCDDLPQ
jgi:hypothetical protein